MQAEVLHQGSTARQDSNVTHPCRTTDEKLATISMLEERQREFRAELEGVVAWSKALRRAGVTRKGDATWRSGSSKSINQM